MAIPASYIVDIEPRVITGGSSNLEFNGLFLSKNEIIPAGSVKEFTSAASVGEYFGEDGLEHLAATKYFTGYVNKWAAPRRIMFARRIDEDVPAWIRSAAVTTTLAELVSIAEAAIDIEIQGVVTHFEGLEFSDCTSLSEVATKIGEKLSLDCTYSSLTKAFTLTSKTVGEDSSLGYAVPVTTLAPGDVDLGILLGFTEDGGAVLSQGMDAMGVNAQMAEIRGVTENWFSFTTMWEAEVDEALEYASWANDNYGWMYVPYSMSALMVSSDSDQDMASQIKDAGYDHVAVIYGTVEYAAFIMSCCACIDWERTNSTITLAFKKQSGLAALVTREAEADTLKSKRCNYVGIWATRNSDFTFQYEGMLSASDYGYIDSYVNHVWLNNRLQVAIMDGLTLAARVPYTQRGYTMIRSWMMDPVNEGKNNGVIESGVTLSELQKSELFNEAGMDISNELWTQGYFISVKDPGASVRAERGTPETSLWFCYGGSVHKVVCGSTVVL